jgi:hypothetical protein
MSKGPPIVKKLRSLIVAVIVLAMSAGAALAGRSLPRAASAGLPTAPPPPGKTVPVRPPALGGAPATAAAAGDDDGEGGDAVEAPATAPTQPANHGATVSAAAQGATPAGFTTHGAYVSSIARINAGAAASTKGKTEKAAHAPTAPSH